MIDLDEIGDTFVCVRFEDAAVAKAAWERASSLMRGINVTRMIDKSHGPQHLVMLMGERVHSGQIEELGNLLETMGGTRIDGPTHAVSACRSRRAGTLVRGTRNQTNRWDPGVRVDPFGRLSDL